MLGLLRSASLEVIGLPHVLSKVVTRLRLERILVPATRHLVGMSTVEDPVSLEVEW